MQNCIFCGEPQELELLDIFAGGEFLLSTCCAELHEAVVEDMQNDETRQALLLELGVESYIGQRLRRVPAVDGQFLLDFNPHLAPIDIHQAREFVNQHHAHNKAPAGWRFGSGIFNGDDLVGVIMVGRPVARMIDASTTVEVNRLCIRRDVPRERVWNCCSMAYAWAAREARRRGFSKIITYTLESEAGTTLKAAGWHAEAVTRGGSWHRPSRARVDQAPTCRKIRWARPLAAASA